MNVLSQFTDEGRWPGLKRCIDVPGVYPAGRLDRDSEGLLVLTDNGRLQARISHPRYKAAKVYWVQVEGAVDGAALDALQRGVSRKDGPTKPAKVRAIPPPEVWPRTPPVRVRKTVPDSWIELTLREGRNRQIRRMTAAVGHPTLRLIRVAIGPWGLGSLKPGEFIETTLHPQKTP